MLVFTAVIAVFAVVQGINSFLQWRSMERTISLSNRAWLVVKSVDQIKIEAGQPFRITLRIENTGRSPAFNLVALTELWEFAGPLPEELPHSPASGPVPSRGIVGNGHVQGIPTQEHVLTAEKLAAIPSGRLTFATYGRITYDDALGYGYETLYCAVYDVTTTPPSFRFCPRHNAVR